MEHRYADDSRPSWYTDAGRYPPGRYAGSDDPDVSGAHALDDNPYDSGVHRTEEPFRVPEQRHDPLTSTGGFGRVVEPESRPGHESVRIPVRGPEYPAVRPAPASVPPVAGYPSATSASAPPAASPGYGLSATPAGFGPPATTTGYPPASADPYGTTAAPNNPADPYGTTAAPNNPADPYGTTAAPNNPAVPYGGAAAPNDPAVPFGTAAMPGDPPAPFGPTAAPNVPAGIAEPTGLVPPVAADRPGTGQNSLADGVYRSRRPSAAVVLAAIVGVLLLPALRLLLDATFAADPNARDIVSAVLLTLGLPLTGVGLYALPGAGRDAWSRPPAVYLPAGLIILVAAGLAAG